MQCSQRIAVATVGSGSGFQVLLLEEIFKKDIRCKRVVSSTRCSNRLTFKAMKYLSFYSCERLTEFNELLALLPS